MIQGPATHAPSTSKAGSSSHHQDAEQGQTDVDVSRYYREGEGVDKKTGRAKKMWFCLWGGCKFGVDRKQRILEHVMATHLNVRNERCGDW
jgi:hypothetical protein